MTTWNDLSIREKAEIMRVAVRNGITTLPEIREAYNKFAEGGPEDENKPLIARQDNIKVANRYLDEETQAAIDAYNASHIKEQQEAAQRNAEYARRAKMSGAVENVYPEFDLLALGRGIATSVGKQAGNEIVKKQVTDVKSIYENNYTKWTNKQWDAAYNSAIKSNDIKKAERLRALHAKNSIGTVYRGHPSSVDAPISFGEKQPVFTTTSEVGASNYGIVEPYYIKIENPRTLDYRGQNYDAKIIDDLYLDGHPFYSLDRKANKARDLGHDALIVKNVKDGTNYPIDEYIVLDPRKIKSASTITFDDAGNIIPLSQRDNYLVNDVRYAFSESTPSRNAATEVGLSSDKIKTISKYANSQENAAKQLKSRISNPDYAQIIRRNSNAEYPVGKDPIYIEGKNRNDNEVKDLLAQVVTQTFDSPIVQTKTYASILNGLRNNQSFAIPFTNYAYIPKKDILLSKSYFTPRSGNAARQHQYSIIKSHEGSHAYAHPKVESPLHSYIDGLNKNYFTMQNDAELSARGSQLKSYFNKKTVTEDELKYAANNYVKDTGVDNNMSEMFNYINKASKDDPAIWKKMARWFSYTSPVLAAGTMINTNE